MIINENNKDSILKGIMRRGFNQDPKDIVEKRVSSLPKKEEPKVVIPKKDTNLRDTLVKFNRLNK